jgi:hypothetical protein
VGEPTLLASVQLAEGRPADSAERELLESIWHRHTSRAPFSARRVPLAVQTALEQAASAEFTLLRLLPDDDAALVARLAADASQELAENFDHRVELCRWIGTEGDDGVPAAALGSQPDRAPAPVRDFGYAAPMTPRPSGSYEPVPHLTVLATAHDEPADWLRAGQALQRVLLTATLRGIAASPLTQPLETPDAWLVRDPRRCSGCCSPRPRTASPRRSSTSRWSCTTCASRRPAGGRGRSARRSSSGSATGRPGPKRPGARWRTFSTARPPPGTAGPHPATERPGRPRISRPEGHAFSRRRSLARAGTWERR